MERQDTLAGFAKSLGFTLVSVFCFHLLLTGSFTSAQPNLLWEPLNEPGIGGRVDSIAISPHDSNHLLAGGDVLGARISTDRGNSWSSTSGWLSYELSDFTWHPQDPNIVWAGSLSGPHLSTDGGKNWKPQRIGMPPINSQVYSAPVEKVLFDPNSDDLLAFGGDHRQLKSEDDVLNYGAVWKNEEYSNHWKLLSKIVEGSNIMAASYAGSSEDEIFAAVWEHGVFYSSDDGISWTNRSRGLPKNSEGKISVSSLVVHPNNPETLWVTVADYGIFMSTSGGNSWQLLDNGIPTSGSTFWTLAVGSDGETLYAGNRNYEYKPGVYKSIDGGFTWERVFYNTDQIRGEEKPYPGGINPWWIAVDLFCSNTVYTGTDNAIYRSSSGGKEWTILTAGSTAQGWQGKGFSGLVSRNIEWNPYSPKHFLVQGKDGAKVVQSWDGGLYWRVENPGFPPFGGGNDVAFTPNWIFVVLGQGGSNGDLIARSSDSGHSWTLLQPPVSPSEATQVHADPINPNRLWVVIGNELWYTTEATETTAPRWTRLEVGKTNNAVGDLEAIPNKNQAFYIATDDGIYYTPDGLTFDPVGGLRGAKNVELAIAPSRPDILYAAQEKSYWGDYGLWRFKARDNEWTRTWNNRDVASWIGDISIHPINPNWLAVVTDDYPYHDETWASGVWISIDGGNTWRQENQGLPMVRGSVVSFHPDGESVVVGLRGGGFYKASF